MIIDRFDNTLSTWTNYLLGVIGNGNLTERIENHEDPSGLLSMAVTFGNSFIWNIWEKSTSKNAMTLFRW